MSLETWSNIASIISAIVGIIGLFGLGMIVYKLIFKQENKSSFTIHGDVNGDVVTGGIKGRDQFKDYGK